MSPAPGRMPDTYDFNLDSHQSLRAASAAHLVCQLNFLLHIQIAKSDHSSDPCSMSHYLLSISSPLPLRLGFLAMIIPGVSMLSSGADALSRHLSYHDGDDAAFLDAIAAENATHIGRSRDLQHHLNYEKERHRKQILAIRTHFSGPQTTDVSPLTSRAKRDIKARVRQWGKQQAHQMRRTTQG